MNKCIDYIADLLFLHDDVIVPNLGGFVGDYRDTYVDEKSGVIYPATKRISFNRKLTQNDGVLVDWIMEQTGVSREQASKQIELFCQDIRVELNQGKKVDMGDIGVLYSDKRFNVIFEAGYHNFLADTYGMEPIDAHRLETFEKRKRPAQTKKEVRELKEMKEMEEMREREVEELKEFVDVKTVKMKAVEGKGHNIFLQTLKYVAIVVAIAGAGLATYTGIEYWSDEPVEATGTAPNDYVEYEPIIPSQR
ncbi:hypothetical protein FACS1894199_07130 [Bacteroidia bacterium]|nr:hypothetical protein FACS1894199_07130 [Bacteroidia bacterium]